MMRRYWWVAVVIAGIVTEEVLFLVFPVNRWVAMGWPVMTGFAVWQVIGWQRMARQWEEVAEGWQQCADAWRHVAWKTYARRAESLDWWERIMREGERR